MKGHGISDADIKRQYALADEFFNLPLEEKVKYSANTAAGDFRGYKAKASGENAGRDNDERYNIPKFTPEHERPHPQLILDHYEEIKEFSLVRKRYPEPLLMADRTQHSIFMTKFFYHCYASLPMRWKSRRISSWTVTVMMQRVSNTSGT